MGVVHQLELQQRRAADQVLGPLGVLDARQLDQDAVFALAPDVRLGDAELVDAVANGFEGLVHRQLLHLLDVLVRQVEDRRKALRILAAVADPQVAQLLVQKGFELVDVLLALHLDADLQWARALHAGVLDLVFPHQFADFLEIALDTAFDGLLGVDLQHEVHAALQIQAEIDLLVRPERGVEGGQAVDQRGDDHRQNDHQSDRKAFQGFILISFITE